MVDGNGSRKQPVGLPEGAPPSEAARANDTQPLGAATLTFLVIANMIGAGVFISHQQLSGSDFGGSANVLLWLAGGAIALLGAISYAGLAKQLTQSGGEYYFLRQAIGPLAGFMAGWISLFAGFSGALTLTADSLVGELKTLLPKDWMSFPGAREVWMLVVIGVGSALHFVRVRPGANAQNGIVILKLLLLGTLLVCGVALASPLIISASDLSGRTSTMPTMDLQGAETFGPLGLLVAAAFSLVTISFAYSGFNAAIYVAGESTHASRNVPRAILLGTTIVATIYVALSYIWTATGLLQSKFVTEWYLQLFSATKLLALVTSVTSLCLAGPRVIAKMASDGGLPSWLAAKDGQPPRAAIAAQGLIALGISGLPIHGLFYTMALLSLSASATALCLLLPSYRGKPGARPVILWPLPPVLFAILTLIMFPLNLFSTTQSSMQAGIGSAILTAVGVLAVGLIVYASGKQSSRLPRTGQ
jgi:amino acid transporter